MKRSIRRESYHKDFQSQCIYLLNIWIQEYLDRHGLEYLEIDYRSKTVFYYSKDSCNALEDYSDFDYTKINLLN